MVLSGQLVRIASQLPLVSPSGLFSLKLTGLASAYGSCVTHESSPLDPAPDAATDAANAAATDAANAAASAGINTSSSMSSGLHSSRATHPSSAASPVVDPRTLLSRIFPPCLSASELTRCLQQHQWWLQQPSLRQYRWRREKAVLCKPWHSCSKWVCFLLPFLCLLSSSHIGLSRRRMLAVRGQGITTGVGQRVSMGFVQVNLGELTARGAWHRRD